LKVLVLLNSNTPYYKAIIRIFVEQNENYRIRHNELYKKWAGLLQGSGKKHNFSDPSKKLSNEYKPSKNTFSEVIKQARKDNIIERSVKIGPIEEVYYSLTDDAKIMRKLHILGTSDEHATFKEVHEKILLYVVFPIQTENSPKSFDEFLSPFKSNRNGLSLGISIEDFSKSTSSKFQPEIVNQAFTLLDSENIIRKTFLDNEVRFVLKDERLQQLMASIGRLFVDEMYLLNCKWHYVRPPTEEESNRLEWLVGNDLAKIIVNTAKLQWHQNKISRESKNKEKRSKNVDEYIKYLKRGNNNEFELSLIDSALELYKNSIGSSNDDIQQYFNILENRFKELQTNFANKIKDIQGRYKQTIEKYRFLFQHVLNHFCPLLLKHLGPNIFEHLTSHIDMQEYEKRAKLIEMVYVAASRMS
jgi:hypothetical protein